MPSSPERPNSENAPPYREQIENIVKFAKENNITGEELFSAYQLALGISPDESGHQPSENISELVRLMNEQMDNGLPVNRLAELISGKFDYEAIPRKYKAIVETLIMTEREKKVLYSIVDKSRWAH